jgi:hypothetical protein
MVDEELINKKKEMEEREGKGKKMKMENKVHKSVFNICLTNSLS